MYAEDFSIVNVNDSEFESSTALLGGVIYTLMSEAHFTSSKMSGNTGYNSDALSNFYSRYSVFTGDASTGGAVAATLSSIVLNNCLAFGNSAHQGMLVL